MNLVKKPVENDERKPEKETDQFRRFDLSCPPLSTPPSPATLPPPPTNTRPPTSCPGGGVVCDQSPERNVDDVALGYPSARTRRDPLRYVFESSVHAKRMQARPPTSRPAGGVVRGGHLDDGEERLALARRGAAGARWDFFHRSTARPRFSNASPGIGDSVPPPLARLMAFGAR
jgi:hypothetical protein